MRSLYLIKPYLQENRYLIFLGIICLIAVDFLQLFIPRIIKWAVDDLTAYQADTLKLFTYALYIVGIAVMIGMLRYLWRRFLIGTSRRVEEGLRNRLFAHIQTLSASYFDNVQTGDLMAHATNDIQHVRMATGMGMVALTDAIVLGTASIGFMAYINVKLTLFVLIPAPMIALGARFFSKKMHRLYGEVQASFSDITEAVRERFAGIRIIKAYNKQKEAASRLESISKDYIGKNLSLVKITGSFFPMMLLFSNLSLAIVLFLGGRQTITLTITPGDFVAFISYLGLLTWPMMAIGWVTNLIQRGKASLNRIDKIMQTHPDIDDFPAARSINNLKGSVMFDNVSFSYPSDSSESVTKFILSDINFQLDHGNILGIVGPPGSGKTTLLSLIPRIFDTSQGRILISGIDIRDIQVRHLRSQIAFVSQEPFLFADTIWKNITFANRKIHDTELTRATEEACVYDTVQSFPDAFETIVGEKGVILSGGQKQRVALARALIHNPAILILDDPISQVDMETGSSIINTIRSKANRSTIIIVSHRLSAVRFADQIIALAKGRIVESGTHDELMANDEYYAKTFRLQEIEEQYAH
ncbi:MAG: ABC transporter ATP-binding protein [Desulfobacterales bacterium]|nr:MAG: ABC transporter ATP-binding protein [Desulfobacterales bacterium]